MHAHPLYSFDHFSVHCRYYSISPENRQFLHQTLQKDEKALELTEYVIVVIVRVQRTVASDAQIGLGIQVGIGFLLLLFLTLLDKTALSDGVIWKQ